MRHKIFDFWIEWWMQCLLVIKVEISVSNISSSFASKNGVFKGFRSYPSQSYTPTPTSSVVVENAKSGAFLKRQSHSRINASN